MQYAMCGSAGVWVKLVEDIDMRIFAKASTVGYELLQAKLINHILII